MSKLRFLMGYWTVVFDSSPPPEGEDGLIYTIKVYNKVSNTVQFSMSGGDPEDIIDTAYKELRE